MYFFGLVKYSSIVLSSQVIPLDFIAFEYEKPAAVPDFLPITPWRFGPTLWGPPYFTDL